MWYSGASLYRYIIQNKEFAIIVIWINTYNKNMSRDFVFITQCLKAIKLLICSDILTK